MQGYNQYHIDHVSWTLSFPSESWNKMLLPYKVTKYPQMAEPTNEVVKAWTLVFFFLFFFPSTDSRYMLGASEPLQKYRTLPERA